MAPPDELWRVEFSVMYAIDGRIYHGCECFLTRLEAEMRASQMRTSTMKFDIQVSHYKRTATI